MRISYLKYFYILLIVFILSMLGSFAFFSWESGNSDNTNVSFDVVADTVYIYYDAGSNINGGDLYPTDDKNDGISKDITVKISGVVESKPVAFNLYLDLTDVPEELMDDSFKWALYNGSEELGTGSITKNITNCTENNTMHIVLFNNNITTVEKQNYTLYLWIDGNMTNPDTMMNKSFKVNLHADGTNATLIEGNSMSLISLERNGGNNVNITLQSLMYNFDSYAISDDGTTEPTSWTDMGCSDNSCNTNDRNVYQKTLNNVDLVYVNGLSYVWLKDVEGRIAKIEISKNYIITLNNNSATTAGTTTIYGIYKDGFYKDSSYKEKYEINDKIIVPTKTNYIFDGYYDSDDKMVIDSEGNFVSGMQSIYYDDITLNAKWKDNRAPTVSLINSSDGNWTNQNITVTLNYNDDGSGINASSLQYSTDNINWTSIENTSSSGYTDTWYDERNSTVYYKICDNAGNCSTTSTIIKIDKTSPKLTISNPTNGSWTNHSIDVIVSFSDSASGINASSLFWSIDNQNWVSISNTSTSSYTDTWGAERNDIVYYKICDTAGNCNTASTSIKIDKTSPKLTISNSTNGSWTNHSIDVIVSFSDSASGINASSLFWSIDNQNWVSISNTSTSSYTDTWGAERNDIVYYKICDTAGNCNTASTSIKIDKTSPKLTISNPTNGNVSNVDITVKLTFSDSASGINASSLSWSIDNQNWVSISNTSTSSYNDTWSAERNNIVYYKICDNAGNCMEESTPIKIKKTFYIYFDANGGSGAPDTQSYIYSTTGTITLSSTTPSKDGYNFLGWSTSSTAGSPSYYAGGSFSKTTASNTTLYAVWGLPTGIYEYRGVETGYYEEKTKDFLYITTCDNSNIGNCNYTAKNADSSNGTIARSKLKTEVTGTSNIATTSNTTTCNSTSCSVYIFTEPGLTSTTAGNKLIGVLKVNEISTDYPVYKTSSKSGKYRKVYFSYNTADKIIQSFHISYYAYGAGIIQKISYKGDWYFGWVDTNYAA